MDKINFYNLQHNSQEIEGFKENLAETYSFTQPLFYQIVEFLFRQAMSHNPKDIDRSFEDNRNYWFGGYKYDQLKIEKALLKKLSFDERLMIVVRGIEEFNKKCLVGEFGFTLIGLTKFSNIDKVFEDYSKIVESLKSTDKSKFLDVIDKYPQDQIRFLIKSTQEMIENSLAYNDRKQSKLVLFDKDGNMVITPKHYEYFNDYLTMGEIFWESYLQGMGKKRQGVNHFLKDKIRFEHIGNAVNTYDSELKVKSRIELDEEFFKQNFNVERIGDRLRNLSNYSQKSKAKNSFIEKYFFPRDFSQKLGELYYSGSLPRYVSSLFKKSA